MGALWAARSDGTPTATAPATVTSTRAGSRVSRSSRTGTSWAPAGTWSATRSGPNLVAAFGGLAVGEPGGEGGRRAGGVAAGESLDEWPVARPADWERWVDEAGSEAELDALRRCGRRGRPYGGEGWLAETAARLGLASSLRPVGRPPKTPTPPEAAPTASTGSNSF